jgi:ADP-heptose:LPS heptosyltransferase
MDEIRRPVDASWHVVTFKKPLLWTRTEEEVWLFQPRRRYILNSNQLEKLGPHINAISDLKGCRQYRPLQLGANLANATILAERYRDRGVGDMLFLTGPLNYMMHTSGHSVKVDLYGLTDRHQILGWHPTLEQKAVLAGPVMLDDLPLYQYHWFTEKVTEYVEEQDQPNVYDCLFAQLGLDPATVDPRFKRPTLQLVDKDRKDLDSLYYFIFNAAKLDLRTTPYYVFAPLSHSTLRTAPYGLWLAAIAEASKVRPVVVVGHTARGQVPASDMPFGEFQARLGELCRGGRVINCLGETPIRVTAALIERAQAVVSLDSGLLYVAQAMRVPAISLWGTHPPHSRLGYDKAYMELAIWHRAACPASPCFAYAGFPHAKCIRGDQQRVCDPLAAIKPSDILDKLAAVEVAAKVA